MFSLFVWLILGPKHGLRLTLNTELYEYMSGPNDAAGVHVCIYVYIARLSLNYLILFLYSFHQTL